MESEESRALALAEKRGRELERQNGLIESHERRLNAINGSIERKAKAIEAVSKEVSDLKTAFDTSIKLAAQRSEDAKLAAEKVADQQLSIRQLWGGGIALLAALSAVMTAIVALVH